MSHACLMHIFLWYKPTHLMKSRCRFYSPKITPLFLQPLQPFVGNFREFCVGDIAFKITALLTPFLTGSGLLHKILPPLNDFLYGELYIILKPSKVTICEHSIFSKKLLTDFLNPTL